MFKQKFVGTTKFGGGRKNWGALPLNVLRRCGSGLMGSTFIFLKLFNLAHICIQVTSLHAVEKFELISKFLIEN